jgi:hypothetical protein
MSKGKVNGRMRWRMALSGGTTGTHRTKIPDPAKQAPRRGRLLTGKASRRPFRSLLGVKPP